ncbi:MAG TPA: PASTA domain-containing protein [Solirubrobacteraceae bacterium]|nr:PASTA domain-containing protein [Solirubrobacteraceae bacterium]
MIEPQTIVDKRYRILSRIGSGGMADVYLAEDLLLGRQLAVKVLHHHFAEDQEFVERFRREASSAAALSHPNIVGIFDRGEWDGTYYIAMEYVPGQSLKTLVREHGPLQPLAAIDITTQILRAARFAHARGVIHRDLKPHNVILDEEGRARVTDFGIARAGASDMTLTGSIMGTAQYLSPEQAQGHTVSGRSDLYAIGVILYELLTGTIPFDGDSAVAIAFKQVSAQPQPPSAVNPAVPAPLDEIVLRALAKDPAARYASADEFIAALQGAREQLPAAATTVLATAPAPLASSAAAAAAAAGVAAAATSTGAAEPGSDAPSAAAPGTSSAGASPAAVPLEALSTDRASGGAAPADGAPGRAPSGYAEGAPQGPPRPTSTGTGSARALVPPGTALSTGIVPSGLLMPAGAPPGQPPSADDAAAQAAKRRRLRWALAIAALVLIAAAVAALLLLPSSSNEVSVPGVTGRSESQAAQTLRAAGLVPVPSPTTSSAFASGSVISQSPSAGTEVKRGAHVTIFVSSGPGSAAVPDVTGEAASQATSKLKAAGFRPTSETQSSSTVASGRVIATDPPAETVVRAGGSVTVIVSGGPAPVAAPDVVGQSRAAAEATLSNAGLAVGTVTKQTTGEQSPGTVLAQSPAAGTQLSANSKVELTVAQAPTEVTVPNVVGENEFQAAAKLGRAGFSPKRTTQTTVEAALVGLVLKQTPSASHKAAKGATVTIAIGVLAPQTTTTTTPATTPSTTPTTPSTPPASAG